MASKFSSLYSHCAHVNKLYKAVAAAPPEAPSNTARPGWPGLRASPDSAPYTLTPAHVTTLTILHDKHELLADEASGIAPGHLG
jgi:hypothetical protein